MQILKEEIRNDILISAKVLFLEYGYITTSIDKIAKKAGISKSNLYNYFEKKEDIYDTLVAGTVSKLSSINEHFSSIDFDLNAEPDVFLHQFIKTISGLIEAEKDSLLLLLDSASGTKYANFLDDTIDVFTKKFSRRMINNENPKLIAKVLATSLIQGVISILKYSNTKKEIIENLTALSIYHTNGIKTLIV